MKRDVRIRPFPTVLAAGLGLLLAACSAGAAATPSAPLGSATATPAATTAVSTAAPPSQAPGATPAAVNRQVSELDNGQTVAVPLGSTVTLVLHNTYWQVQGSSNPAILDLVSGPTTVGAAPGACIPGAGCGTVTAVFRAIAPGHPTITAARTTCGEALRCTGTAGAYEVTIAIGR